VELARGYTELITSRLGDERWYLVRNLISILGRMRAADALPQLRQAFYHPNPWGSSAATRPGASSWRA